MTTPTPKTITSAERLQLIGLLAIAKTHNDALTAITRTAETLTGDRDGVHTADAVYCAYDIEHLLERLHITVADTPAMDLAAFWESHAAWSEATFGTAAELSPIGPLKHLAMEAVEAQKDLTDLSEFADCLLLTFDAARRAGFTYEELVAAAWAKLEINKARKWQVPTKGDEAVEHDRTGE